jgi:hypothetical protein
MDSNIILGFISSFSHSLIRPNERMSE